MRPLALLLLLCVVSGCSKEKPRSLSDTEGRKVKALCKREGGCKLKQVGGATHEGHSKLSLHRDSRHVGLCSVNGEAKPTPADCRPLVCEKNADCPPAHGMKHGNCINQYCVEPTAELAVADSIMLCLAGTGFGKTDPKQVGLYAMALNCGEPCKVPAPCRQP